MENITPKQFIKDMERAARQFSNPSPKFIKFIMGNTVVLIHNVIRLNFARGRSAGKEKWPKQSAMTLAFKKAAGRGNKIGKQSGAMGKAIGPRLKKGEGRISNRDFIRWSKRGYRFGDNMPDHAKYFGVRISQQWTQKQAAFLHWKLQRARRIGEIKDFATEERKINRALKAGLAGDPDQALISDLDWTQGGGKKAARIGRRFQKKFRQKYEDISGDLGGEPGQPKQGGGKEHIKPKREIMVIDGKTVNRATNMLRSDIIDYLLHPNQLAS